ncbi:FxLD family lanthipeptide [Kitasatospora sp. NPDC056651]|uniref:FxLD family lanthipeptide n=3 Tax=unclassified Kitasatospora TaxID=2633591 RepID=UPI0036B6B393
MPSFDTSGISNDKFTAGGLEGAVRQQAGEALREDGLLRLARLGGRDDVLLAAGRLMSSLRQHRDADPDGLTVIRDTGRHSGRPGFAGLGRGALALHTECTQHPDPPRLLLLACARAGDSGGETLLVDGRAVLAELTVQHPGAIEAFSAERAAYFGGSSGRFAPVFQQLPAGRWQLRLRQDDLARFSPEAQAHLPALRQAIDRNTRRLRLAPGQGVVLDNHRLLHGRTGFSGERLILRALGDPAPALGLGTGFLQSCSPASLLVSHEGSAGASADSLALGGQPSLDPRHRRPTDSWRCGAHPRPGSRSRKGNPQGGATMAQMIPAETKATTAVVSGDEFDLDVRTVETADAASLQVLTDDGCGSTCGACTTGVH